MNIYSFLRRHLKLPLAASLLVAGLAGCTKDLDRTPYYDLNTELVYKDPANYIKVLAKCYAGFNMSGNSGNPDVFAGQQKDEGETSYLRAYWYLQELTTDEAVVAWNSVPLQELNTGSWSTSNDLINNSYTRILYEVALCNEFIRETTDDKLSSRNIGGADATMARTYRAEARFLRALAYYHGLDMYGNIPFTTEADIAGKDLPKQTTRAALFAYIAKELREIQPTLLPAHQAPYGRADRGAAWTLAAKLYLNAPVYTGTTGAAQTAQYDSCLAYCNKVVPSYTLAPDYAQLFMADNNVTSASEIIFPLTSDGRFSQTYGGTTYLVHAAVGGRMLSSAFGIGTGWAGNRTRKNLPLLFPDPVSGTDNRAMFFTRGQNLEIDDLTLFTEGYAVTKWTNKTSTGANGGGGQDIFVDTDFPLFRLADVYLMYAEAVLRGGRGGNPAQALRYMNALRDRAFGNASGVTDGNITAAEMTTDFILDERARELYWEGTRRTDLVRFGKFTKDYNWPYKGWRGGMDIKTGRDIAETRNLYPLPSVELVANPSLVQNPGY